MAVGEHRPSLREWNAVSWLGTAGKLCRPCTQAVVRPPESEVPRPHPPTISLAVQMDDAHNEQQFCPFLFDGPACSARKRARQELETFSMRLPEDGRLQRPSHTWLRADSGTDVHLENADGAAGLNSVIRNSWTWV